MDDVLMILGLLLVGLITYRGINNKPIIPGMKKRNRKKTVKTSSTKTTELQGPFRDLIGIKKIYDNQLELKQEGQDRVFVGAVKVKPINYALKSVDEKIMTDNAFEDMLARLNLGAGREVPFVFHVQSRPIELVDQLKPYHDNFPNLSPSAQRYASSMFFPHLNQWQSTVSDYDYERYIFFTLEFTPNMIEGHDEEIIVTRAKNEFVRLSNTVIRSYRQMGGVAHVCNIGDLLEALYFATHKSNASIEEFRRIMNKEGLLSYIIQPDFDNFNSPAYHFDETKLDQPDEDGGNEDGFVQKIS